MWDNCQGLLHCGADGIADGLFRCLDIDDLEGTGDTVDLTGLAASPGVGIVVFVDPQQHVGAALLRGADNAAVVLIDAQGAELGVAAAIDAFVVQTRAGGLVHELDDELMHLGPAAIGQGIEGLEETAGSGDAEGWMAHGWIAAATTSAGV